MWNWLYALKAWWVGYTASSQPSVPVCYEDGGLAVEPAKNTKRVKPHAGKKKPAAAQKKKKSKKSAKPLDWMDEDGYKSSW